MIRTSRNVFLGLLAKKAFSKFTETAPKKGSSISVHQEFKPSFPQLLQNNKTVLLNLMQKNNLCGIEVGMLSKRNQNTVRGIRLDDKRYNKYLFQASISRDQCSLERLQRKVSNLR